MNPQMRRSLIDATEKRYAERFGQAQPSSYFAFGRANIGTRALLDAIDKVSANDELNDVGRKRAIEKAAGGDPVNAFRMAHSHHKTKLNELRQARAKLATPNIDRKDLAEVLLRAEIRATVRSMPAGERLRFIFDQEDPIFLAAMLEVPAAMTGLQPAQIAELQSAYIGRTSPTELNALKAEEEALEYSAIALNSLGEALKEALQLDAKAWPAWLQETIGDTTVAERPEADPLLERAA